MSARNGKIARLPKPVREELNRRLENGESGPRLAAWLNALPAVQAVVAAEFHGQPVSEQNLSAWRQGGYADWLRHQEACDWARTLAEEAQELGAKAGSVPLADHLSAPMALALAGLLREAAASDGDPAERQRTLLAASQALAALRRCDREAARMRVEQERWEKEQQEAQSKDRAAAQIGPLHGLLLATMFGDMYERKAKETGTIPLELLAFLSSVNPAAARQAGVPEGVLQTPGIKVHQGASS